MVDFSNPATQTRITSTGLIGTANAAKPVYTPQPINMSFINTGVDKPAADWVNPDKELAEQKQMQQDSIDLQKEQFAASMEAQNRALELSYYQYALAMKNSNKKSGKLICSRCYELGLMEKTIFELDQIYGEVMLEAEPEFMEFYHDCCPWFLRKMKNDTWLSKQCIKMIWWFCDPMSREMASRIFRNYKGSLRGKFWLWLFYQFFLIAKQFKTYDAYVR
jgi:hypothetical protein